MKKILTLVLVTFMIAAAGSSCKKALLKIFPGLNVDAPEIVLTIPFFPFPPGMPVPAGEIGFPPYTQHFNLDSIVRANTGGLFNAGDVSSVKVKQIVFTILNPDSLNNLANFESARFTLHSNSNTVPAPIGSVTFPDNYAVTSTYTPPATSPELRPYLDGTDLVYTVYGKLRRYTTKSLNFSVNVTLRVN